MSNKYHRQGFSAAGIVTKTLSKAATKAAEKIKKIDKKDIINFSGAYKKRVKALRSLNKPAVDEYKKTVKEIFSRVTKGKSKEDQKDLAKASSKLNKELFRGSRDLVKRYEDLPDIRSRFRPPPGPKRKLVKGVKNPMKRSQILYEDRIKKTGPEDVKKYKPRKFKRD